MTGFTATEYLLSTALARRIARGELTETAAHVTGSRTVGPLVTLQVHDGYMVYATNGTPSLPLGRTRRSALAAIAAIPTTTGV